jgi:hypothetical protein
LLVKENLAFVRSDQSGSHIEGRGLAGAVRPEKSHDFPLCNVYGDMVRHCARAITFHEVFCAQNPFFRLGFDFGFHGLPAVGTGLDSFRDCFMYQIVGNCAVGLCFVNLRTWFGFTGGEKRKNLHFALSVLLDEGSRERI